MCAGRTVCLSVSGECRPATCTVVIIPHIITGAAGGPCVCVCVCLLVVSAESGGKQRSEHHVVVHNEGLSVYIVAENGPRHSSRRKCDFTNAFSPPTLGQILTVIHGYNRTDGPNNPFTLVCFAFKSAKRFWF